MVGLGAVARVGWWWACIAARTPRVCEPAPWRALPQRLTHVPVGEPAGGIVRVEASPPHGYPRVGQRHGPFVSLSVCVAARLVGGFGQMPGHPVVRMCACVCVCVAGRADHPALGHPVLGHPVVRACVCCRKIAVRAVGKAAIGGGHKTCLEGWTRLDWACFLIAAKPYALNPKP